MEEHPSPEKLRRFVAGELSHLEARKIMAHLFKGCQFCREEASRYNFLHLSRTLRPASASNQSHAAAREAHYPAFASSAARSKM